MSNLGLLEQHHKVFWNAGKSLLNSKELAPILDIMKFWEKHHGIKWLIERMKLLELLMIGKSSPTIATTKDGMIKGPFKALHRKFQAGPKRFKSRAIRFLRLHGLFIAKVTRDDYIREALRLSQKREVSEDCFLKAAPWPVRNISPWFIPFGRYPMLESSADFSDTCHADHVKALYNCPKVVVNNASVLAPLLGVPLDSFILFASQSQANSIQIVGQAILLTKDGSYKLRMVYSPFMIFQMALKPLYNAMKQIASKLPSMYHQDQERGKLSVYLLLLTSDVFSIDLHAASDNIPLEPQLDLLRQLLPEYEPLIALYGDIASAHWRTCYQGVYIHLETGQPMGLNVSFLSFSLYLYYLLKEEIGEANFSMVGDDLVVTKGLHVRELFKLLNIPVSDHKCVSGSYAQFCGTVISRDDGDLHALKSRHHKYFTWIAAFGKRILPAIPRQWRFLYFIACLPPPVGVGLKPGTLDLLPPDLLWDLFSPRIRYRVPLVSYPEKDKADYAYGFADAVTMSDDIGPGLSMEDKESLFNLSNYIPFGPRFYCVSPRTNWLAESANCLFKEDYSVEFVVNHLTVLANLFHLPEYVLPLSVIEDGKNRSMNVNSYYHTYKRVKKYSPFKGKPPMTIPRKTKAVKGDVESPKKHKSPGIKLTTSTQAGSIHIPDVYKDFKSCNCNLSGTSYEITPA